jgi:hypothetical protein
MKDGKYTAEDIRSLSEQEMKVHIANLLNYVGSLERSFIQNLELAVVQFKLDNFYQSKPWFMRRKTYAKWLADRQESIDQLKHMMELVKLSGPYAMEKKDDGTQP